MYCFPVWSSYARNSVIVSLDFKLLVAVLVQVLSTFINKISACNPNTAWYQWDSIKKKFFLIQGQKQPSSPQKKTTNQLLIYSLCLKKKTNSKQSFRYLKFCVTFLLHVCKIKVSQADKYRVISIAHRSVLLSRFRLTGRFWCAIHKLLIALIRQWGF